MLESAEKVRIDAFSEEAKGKGVNELNLKLNYKFDGKGEKMDLTQLRKENEVLDIFCNLVSIPSPSLKEEKVIEWILKFCGENG